MNPATPSYAQYGSASTGYYFPSSSQGQAAKSDYEASLKTATPTNMSTVVSNPSGPSSSSTMNVNNNISDSTQNGIDNVTGTKPPLSTYQQRAMADFGLTEDYARTLDPLQIGGYYKGQDQAAADTATAKAEQDQIYQASLAQENSSYAQATQDLNDQKQKDLDTAEATAASLNPYGAPNTDQNNYKVSIEGAYGKLQNTLNNQAEQARAALAAGNSQAYASINANMANIKQTGLANIQNMIASLQQNSTTNSIAQENADTSKTNSNASQSNLLADNAANLIAKGLGPSVDELNKMSDADFMKLDAAQQFAKSNSLVGLPTDVASVRAEVTAGQQHYEDNFGIATTKANAAAQNANTAYTVAQTKIVQLQLAQNSITNLANSGYGSWVTGIKTIASGHPADLKQDANGNSVANTLISNISDSLTAGDVNGARDQLSRYAVSSLPLADQTPAIGLSVISMSINDAVNRVVAQHPELKTDFIQGNYTKFLQKLGTTDSTAKSQLQDEIGHSVILYAKTILGSRPNSYSLKQIQQVFPDITDTKQLIDTKLSALMNTSQDFNNSVLRTALGSSYDSIMGTNASSNTNVTAPTTGATQSYQGANYTFDGTQWVQK